MFLPRLAISSTLLIGVILANRGALGAPPDAGPAQVRQFVNGLSWEITGSPVFAQGDAYVVQARIINHPRYRDREMTLLSGGLSVELWHPAGSFRTQVLFRSGTPKAYKLDDGSVGISASADLREAFGELAPGQWTARWILREGRYQVQGHSESSELVAEYSFEVLATSKDVAAQANVPTADVVLDIVAPGAETPGRTLATLTNHTGHAVEFSAYAKNFDRAKPAWEEPLSTLVQADRLVPPTSWKSLGFGYCGTGVALYRLEPGKSVKIRLSAYRGAQFMRYRLPYRVADQKDEAAREAISGVVQWPAR